MSHYYSVVCAACGEDDARINHGDNVCIELIKNRDALAALAPLFKDRFAHIEGFGAESPPRPEFYAKHAGHKLVVRDEYGIELGRCEKFPSCPHCRQRFTCTLDKDHEGDCKP